MNSRNRRQKGDYIEYKKYRRRKRKIKMWGKIIVLTMGVGLVAGTIVHVSVLSYAKSNHSSNASSQVINDTKKDEEVTKDDKNENNQGSEEQTVTSDGDTIDSNTSDETNDKEIKDNGDIDNPSQGSQEDGKDNETNGSSKEDTKDENHDKNKPEKQDGKDNATDEKAKNEKDDESYAVVKGKYADSDIVKEVSVAKTEKVSSDYFDDALFIGNSRTQGLQINTGLTNATFYADRGLSLDHILTNEFIKDGANRVNLKSALKKHKFAKVYVMFGVNELGWYSNKIFVDRYTELIKEIQKSQPDAQIYVQSVIPVTKKKSDSDKVYTNDKVYLYNDLIAQMTKDLEVNYVNVAEGVRSSDGALVAEASTDGSHLNKKYCEKWLGYLKSHVVY